MFQSHYEANLVQFAEKKFTVRNVNKRTNCRCGVGAIGKHRVKNVGNGPFERKTLLPYFMIWRKIITTSVNLGPVALLSEALFLTPSGTFLEIFQNPHTVWLMYKILTSYSRKDGLLYGFKFSQVTGRKQLTNNESEKRMFLEDNTCLFVQNY